MCREGRKDEGGLTRQRHGLSLRRQGKEKKRVPENHEKGAAWIYNQPRQRNGGQNGKMTTISCRGNRKTIRSSPSSSRKKVARPRILYGTVQNLYLKRSFIRAKKKEGNGLRNDNKFVENSLSGRRGRVHHSLRGVPQDCVKSARQQGKGMCKKKIT